MLSASIAICNPDISILTKMLRSLKEYTPELKQLIVIDNASESRMIPELIKTIFRDIDIALDYVKNDVNVGFGYAHNQALKIATQPYFAVLNDDIEFFETWSMPMINVLEEDSKVGQVCMKTEAFNVISPYGGGIYDPNAEPEYAEGACFMMRLEDARRFNLFDDTYHLAYLEDTDLSLRLRQAGLTIKNVDVKWKHYRAVTSKKIDTKGYLAVNGMTFRKRWSGYLYTRRFAYPVIAINRTASTGDVFLTLPVIEAIKEKYPDSAIVLQTKTSQAVADSPLINAISEPGFPVFHDKFINLDFAYEIDFTKHIVESYAEIAGVKAKRKYYPLAIRREQIEAVEKVLPSDMGKFVVLDISTTWEGKQWSQENYAQIVPYLREKGYRIVLTGVNGTGISKALSYDLNLVNVLDIMQTAVLISKADLFIGHEGLLAHFAQSMRMKNVILYGCTLPEIFNDTSLPNFRPVVSPIECQGCRKVQKGCMIICHIGFECMKRITPEMVKEKIGELI